MRKQMVLLLVLFASTACVEESSKGSRRSTIADKSKENDARPIEDTGRGVTRNASPFFTGINQDGNRKSCREMNKSKQGQCKREWGYDDSNDWAQECRYRRKVDVRCGCQEVICYDPREEEKVVYRELFGEGRYLSTIGGDGSGYGLLVEGEIVELEFQKDIFEDEFSEGCPFRAYGYFESRNSYYRNKYRVFVAVEFELNFYQGWNW